MDSGIVPHSILDCSNVDVGHLVWDQGVVLISN
jgi:hypothetical protein